jgi:pilus assembly protein CpaF
LDRLINEIERIFEESVDYSEAMDDAGVNFLIEKAVNSLCRERHISLDKRKEIVRYLFNKRRKYGVLEPLIQDEDISEIMVNGEKEIFYEKEGKIFKYEDSFDSKETLIKIIRNMMLVANRTINEKNPIADARLINGERICAVLDNIAINGPVLTIRKFSRKYISLDCLIQNNTLNQDMGELIKELVRKRYNIIVSGGTSSGKTTFLNVLSEFIDSGERVITIEDSLELNLEHVKNIIKLEVKEESLMVDAKKLLKTALRLRPDRIIVGEVRGREAFYMLQAMNTGHDGSMSTGHANSSRDMLSRLEGMVSSEFDIPIQSIKSYISSAVDILIHLKKTCEGKRIVREIIQLTGVSGNEYITNTLYEFAEGKFTCGKPVMPKGN